jgi:hypothetical protein
MATGTPMVHAEGVEFFPPAFLYAVLNAIIHLQARINSLLKTEPASLLEYMLPIYQIT